MPILSSAQMRAAEEAAFAGGVEVEALMDKAGAGVAQSVWKFFPNPGKCIVFAGKGSAEIPGKKLIVLDAKYRIEDGLHDALSSIHTYRDALVREGDNGKVEGIVTAAYLLTPYIPELGGDYRSTELPGRLFHPRYRETFRFGAVTMRPGMTLAHLYMMSRYSRRGAERGSSMPWMGSKSIGAG